MIYSISLNNVLTAVLLTFVIFVLKNRKDFYEFYEAIAYMCNEERYIKKYGAIGRLYAWANKKKMRVEDIEIKRSDKIRFFVPCEDMFVEGTFIGIDEDDLFYVEMDIKIDDEDIAVYETRCLKKEHIVYVRPVQKGI
ncbi:MAG: hypothetical protein GX325_10600 [Peptococcaceae bacterium]|nr:hypothetical protein [Peptococcaceae bacterium]